MHHRSVCRGRPVAVRIRTRQGDDGALTPRWETPLVPTNDSGVKTLGATTHDDSTTVQGTYFSDQVYHSACAT